MTGPTDFIQHIHVIGWPSQRDRNNKIPQLFCVGVCCGGHSFSSSVRMATCPNPPVNHVSMFTASAFTPHWPVFFFFFLGVRFLDGTASQQGIWRELRNHKVRRRGNFSPARKSGRCAGASCASRKTQLLGIGNVAGHFGRGLWSITTKIDQLQEGRDLHDCWGRSGARSSMTLRSS